MRVLFLAMHRPERSPGQRFRWEQYLPYLRANGVECDVSFLLSQEDDRVFYSGGHAVQKAAIALRALDQRRLETSKHYLERYDVVFVHREALFFGPPFGERRIAKSPARMVFDFDDAIWIHGISEANKWAGRLKFAEKTREIVRLADLVFAGNQYLADFSRAEGARRVEVIPTTIDTDEYVPADRRREDGPICIGWSGSTSTIVHFESAVPALEKLRARLGDRIRIKVVGNDSYRSEALGVVGLPWRRDTELDDLREMDIGIMPIPDDEWSRGKCGLKGLQYMALGIPTVVSPVGMNAEMVTDGVDGFHATTDDEWVDKLTRLVEDGALRRRLGDAGRQTVLERYSVRSQRDRYLGLLRSLAR